MLWKDEQTILLDSGREVTVESGVIGVTMTADELVDGGGKPLRASSGVAGVSPEPLTPDERLDVLRYKLRALRGMEQNVVKSGGRSADEGDGEHADPEPEGDDASGKGAEIDVE